MRMRMQPIRDPLTPKCPGGTFEKAGNGFPQGINLSRVRIEFMED